MEVIEYLQNNPHIVINRFRHTGVHQALGMFCDDTNLLIYSDDSFEYSDDDESLDEGELPDSTSTPFHVHDVYTETEVKYQWWKLQVVINNE